MGLSENISRTDSYEQVIVLADFVEGIADSVKYAFENLVNKNTRLVLLQTYERPRTGQSVMKDILPVLKKVSRQELCGIKNDLTQQYRIDPDSVETVAWEGSTASFFSLEPNHGGNRYIILGLGKNRITNRFRAKQLVKELEKIRPGNLFLLPGVNGTPSADPPSVITLKWKDVMKELDGFLAQSDRALAIINDQI